MKEIEKQMNQIKEKWGINAFHEIENYCFTLYRKIQDLIKSRDNWKKKFNNLKDKTKNDKRKNIK